MSLQLMPMPVCAFSPLASTALMRALPVFAHSFGLLRRAYNYRYLSPSHHTFFGGNGIEAFAVSLFSLATVQVAVPRRGHTFEDTSKVPAKQLLVQFDMCWWDFRSLSLRISSHFP